MNTDTFPSILGYSIIEQLFQGSRTEIYRGLRRESQHPVVIKVLRHEHPSFGELAQSRNQYEIARHLDHPTILCPLALKRCGNGYALVMPYQGFISLTAYCQQVNKDLSTVLAIAIQLAQALHYLIGQRVIHKDIKPDNILIHPETGQIQLIDFSIASLLPKEKAELVNPNVLEGTLDYISPEQTGRMNRGIDYRTDFYSLGVTLFQILVGELPFPTTDPMELVHCHIAHPVTFSQQSQGDIPEMVRAIIVKLMSKNAEDRYQSALGLQHDLEICLQQWQATGKITAFELGQRDESDRFLIPERLYGREKEVQTLLDAFERVADGNTELMLVAGFSGIGKTAIVSEVHKPITRQKGYFIQGKFDQFNRNVPFSAFVQAFRSLMGQLLAESDTALATWKEKILDAVGVSGQVIIEVIPEIERIIGEQPDVPELSGSAAQNRFNLLFGKFVRVFTTKEHPLVIFLDDLQWADSASLNLLKLLMSESESGYLLVLGAYRDNEVFPAHPLMLAVDEISKQGTQLYTLTLATLGQPDITHLVADTLLCASEIATPLSQLVYQKTQGNPFFTTQFLQGLHEDGCIVFDIGVGYWQCNLAQVRQLALTDDVVEFMVGRLRKLSAATQEVLKIAACIGNRFDLKTLTVVCDLSPAQVAADLWSALQEGLVVPESQTYKFFQGSDDAMSESAGVGVCYRFLHDRVQQAAYCLIPEDEKQSVHLKIGRLLLRGLSLEEQEERLFDLVNQFNAGREQIEQQSERIELARLNRRTAEKAKVAAAYAPALDYLKIATALLPENPWSTFYDLTLAITLDMAEAAYLNSKFALSGELLETVLDQGKTVIDRVKAYEITIQIQITQGRMQEGISTALAALELLGYPIATELQQGDFQVELPAIADLADFPEMTASEPMAALRILQTSLGAVLAAKPQMAPLIIWSQVQLCLKYGHSVRAAGIYGWYGTILCGAMGDLNGGFHAGDLALAVLDQFEAKSQKCLTYNMVYSFIHHWRTHTRESLLPLQEAVQVGLETGQYEYLGYCATNYCAYQFFLGDYLSDVQQGQLQYHELLLKLKLEHAIYKSQVWLQVTANLTAPKDQPTQLVGEYFNAIDMVPKLEREGNGFVLMLVHLAQTLLAYWLGDSSLALAAVTAASPYMMAGMGSEYVTIHNFYHSLAWLAEYPFLELEKQTQAIAQVESNQVLLKRWADHAPMNYLHKWHLVEAERHRLMGAREQAMDAYDWAIVGAKTNQYSQEEALANELAAKFYLEWGKEKVAASYMQEAYYCYARWGAKAKTDHLEVNYPQLLLPILEPASQKSNLLTTLASISSSKTTVRDTSSQATQSSDTNANKALDLFAILKASQVISSTINLEELLGQLTQIILQNSSGNYCALILPSRDGDWQIAAIATQETTTLCSEPLENNPNLPVKLIQYVKNTQETVLIDDLKTDLPIIDEYLNQHHPKSILCLPILNQSHLIGILYLKNRLTRDVFTEDRILILNFLCTQAAISLENARLFQQSQDYSQQLEQSLQTLRTAQEKLLVDEEMMRKQALALVQISESRYVSQGHLREAFQELTEVTAQLLQVERVSIWLFDDGQTQMECMDLFEQSQQQHSGGIVLKVADYPAYFSAVMSQSILPIDDAWTDPCTCEFIHGYLDVFNIFSMLDSSVRLNGVISGVICCEQVSKQRTWNQSEQRFVRSVANLIALAIESNQRQKQAQELKLALSDLKQSELQIVQSEKMSALGNLVAGVAHEINNPLGFVSGNIVQLRHSVNDITECLQHYRQTFPEPGEDIEDLLEDLDIDFLLEDLPKMLDSMEVGCKRIRGISTSLRTFSRADTESKFKANVHEGIDSTLLILKYRLQVKDFRPEIQVIRDYGELPEIECFPGQLNQVFMNLLANAIDMFDEVAEGQTFQEIQSNPQQITIRTQYFQPNCVEIRMSDNGKGMSEEVCSKIFDRKFTTKAVGKGTGLGLAIAHQGIEEKYGGSLQVQSAIGEGTEFLIRLPI